ncbi:phage/plasmid replication domain-containing protein [Pseudomonas aeruginosa]
MASRKLPGPLREARCVSDAGLHPGLHVFQPLGQRAALQVIQALTNVSNGHTKSRGDKPDVRVLGRERSRLKRLKAYLKHTEFQDQLDELKRAGRADLWLLGLLG